MITIDGLPMITHHKKQSIFMQPSRSTLAFQDINNFLESVANQLPLFRKEGVEGGGGRWKSGGQAAQFIKPSIMHKSMKYPTLN